MQYSNYIYTLPDEIISIIYKDVFNNCLDELKRKYPVWHWKFSDKYYCCDANIYMSFESKCQYSSYPNKFTNTCNCCCRPICSYCWNKSITDARAHRDMTYIGWCNNCVWNDIGQ